MTALLTLALAALATASPLPTYSDFYKLLVQVPSPSLDFTPPIHNRYLVGVHIGAGMDMVTPSPSTSQSSTFHTNGTDADLWAARGTVVVGFGRYALAWRTVRSPDDANLNSAVLQYGPGTEGVRVIEERGDLMLGPGQYMVCDRRLPYGLSVEMTTGAVPKECVPVTLLPVCAEGKDGKEGEEGDQTVYRTRCKKL
ncbi:hypothetical protein ISF_09427 [Cordyceps fumosorosea ARSEF 2679]|uniref:DUF7907 domain-containing protein n=1 Tax=Cordyceps fumosorosea (strain ARSEF 2679) TaxID=1081104 RepID=A0A167ILY3_CORFA|nr:hypothetical protein ISF_09427 [Cordyceps fumosorosea ARSEF 2679]OAA49215.1 hypothetical protein ISF_09427 [Cordyceps fumosorosea ARSEF 2679]